MTSSIFIVGAGAVGGSLAVALAGRGCPVVGVCDPVGERARTIAEAAGNVPHFEELPGETARADIVLVAVPDGRIAEVAKKAAKHGLCDSSQIWLHVAGALSAEALSTLNGQVRAVGTFHPALVFAPGQITKIRPDARFAADGEAAALDAARELAKCLDGALVEVPAHLRPLYHASTVLASNCLVALVSEARGVLVRAGLEEQAAESLLTSLASSATDRARDIGVDAGLSGPIRRGDLKTVTRHLEALESAPEVEKTYRLLGLAVARLAERTGEVDSSTREEITRLLEG
ncbi:MAG: DUF2520 domain-containing protein [Deltaproteobacteria bacterium]|nr:DUF2520 domain-containing protein [Deltaproteobacteria bacterium]